MERTGTDRHASVIERIFRIIKDLRKLRLLPCHTSFLYLYLLDDVIGCLNSVTNNKSAPLPLENRLPAATPSSTPQASLRYFWYCAHHQRYA